MHSRHHPQSSDSLETQILRALCAGQISAAERESAMARLANRAWTNPEHKVVYDALASLRTSDAAQRREQLPAQATRMGFPDVEWENYLAPGPGGGADLGALMDMLETPGSA